MYKLVKWHDDERVDILDQEQATGMLALLDDMRKSRVFMLPEGRTAGVPQVESRVIDGFLISNIVAGTTISVHNRTAPNIGRKRSAPEKSLAKSCGRPLPTSSKMRHTPTLKNVAIAICTNIMPNDMNKDTNTAMS